MRWPWSPPYGYRQTVIANTKTKLAFRGVVWQQDHYCLVLRNASLIERGSAKPVDGEVVIPADNVDFLQVVSPGGND